MGSSSDGLNVIVDPPEANIDIVAIHGLNPKNKDNHAEETWTSDGHLWLKDFLPMRLPQARIMLFGYNSNVVWHASTMGVREQAENLLNLLELERSDDPERPLIFVCHSLGGVIIKRALSHATMDRTYQFIRASTYGIIFFGTPHRGGHLASLGDVAAKIARITLNPKNTFLEALKKNSLFGDLINDDFRQQLLDYKIVSFYETRPYGAAGIIVDKASGTLGLPGTIERQIGLDADHTNICKFASKDEPIYVQVERNIVKIVKDATTLQNDTPGADDLKFVGAARSLRSVDLEPRQLTQSEIHRQWQIVPSKPEEARNEELLRSLWFRHMDRRLFEIQAPSENTLQWHREHPDYVSWLFSESAILWIKGKPGAGKSTFMKQLLNQFEANSNQDYFVAAFFVHGQGSYLERSPSGIFRSVLHQLSPHSNSTLSRLSHLYQERCNTRGTFGESWDWTEGELKAELSKLLQSLVARPVLLLIDALDEIGNRADEVVDYLATLIEEAKQDSRFLRICLSCRHFPSIARQGLSICMEEHNSIDIRAYVDQHFQVNKIPSDKAQPLVSAILDRADGVFLWISLVLPVVFRLCRKGRSMLVIQKNITALPSELHDLYKSILCFVPEDEIATTVGLLQWLCFATRRLTLAEFRWVLAILGTSRGYSAQDWRSSETFVEDDEDLRNIIIDMSAGLAEITKMHIIFPSESSREPQEEIETTVHLIHQSVKDFLLKPGALPPSFQPLDFLQPSSGHLCIARGCVRYLCTEGYKIELNGNTLKRKILDISEDFPLIDYVVQEWLHHVVTAERHGIAARVLWEALEPLHTPDSYFVRIWRCLKKPAPTSDTLLHVFAEHNMAQVARNLLEKPSCNINEVGSSRKSSLQVAIEAGSTEMAELLLSQPRLNPNIGGTPLASAISLQNRCVIDLLLRRKDLDINVGAPLFHALQARDKKVMQELLGRADLDPNPGQVLLRTIQQEEVDIAKSLLTHPQLDPNYPYNIHHDNDPPLLSAMKLAQSEVAEMILDHPRLDVNLTGPTGPPVLIWTIRNGKERWMRKILRRPLVDINIRDADGQTPLLMACTMGDLEAVRLLLKFKGIHINARNKWQDTALLIAVQNGQADITAELLSREDIDVNCEDQVKQTPISMAVILKNYSVIDALLRCDRVDINRVALSDLETARQSNVEDPLPSGMNVPPENLEEGLRTKKRSSYSGVSKRDSSESRRGKKVRSSVVTDGNASLSESVGGHSAASRQRDFESEWDKLQKTLKNARLN